MAEYIERESLAADGWYLQRRKYEEGMVCIENMKILDIPAADVTPVVRCQECYAYRKDKELAKAAYLDGEMYCALLRCEMPQDGFCYYGKRNCGARMDGGEP